MPDLEPFIREINHLQGPEDGLFQEALRTAKEEPRARIHSFHRYFGKLIPAIPAFAIRHLTGPGGKVLDPFMGSGTTLVEARRLGRSAIGRDLLPLSGLIVGAKTAELDPPEVEGNLQEVLGRATASRALPAPDQLPDGIRLSHWFREDVTLRLWRLREAIDTLPPGSSRQFLRATFSAVLRDVSNADPRHVFPGYSKRLRALDAEGRRDFDVEGRFLRGVKKRLAAYAVYRQEWPDVFQCRVEQGDSRQAFLPPGETVDLIVTNPPYISSIRYVETVKLELAWMGTSREEIRRLERDTVGTERWYAPEVRVMQSTGMEQVDPFVEALFAAGQPKMSRVVGEYFRAMDRFVAHAHAALTPGGHLVIKISDSTVRQVEVPTHGILIRRALARGFHLRAVFPDAIGGRSLLTKRNSYSGMIERDWILVLQRSGVGDRSLGG